MEQVAVIRVVCISDTHGLHRNLELPEGNILIHAGDFTRHGSLQDAIDFNDWLGTLNFEQKYVVLGNHEHNTLSSKIDGVITNGIVLENRSVEYKSLTVAGLRFSWPLPWSEDFPNPYEFVPENVDILIGHSPPEQACDAGKGCGTIRQIIERRRPQLYVCGHIHHAYGVAEIGSTKVINAAMCGAFHKIQHQPQVFEICLNS